MLKAKTVEEFSKIASKMCEAAWLDKRYSLDEPGELFYDVDPSSGHKLVHKLSFQCMEVTPYSDFGYSVLRFFNNGEREENYIEFRDVKNVYISEHYGVIDNFFIIVCNEDESGYEQSFLISLT